MTAPLHMHEPWFEEACAEAAAAQMRTGFIGPGPATRQFADALATYTGAAFCVPTVSGTVALSVAAIALGLKPGDEILMSSYGVISVINGFASIGLKPRLVDIDPATGSIDPAKIEERRTPATKAVCHVNFSGHVGQGLCATVALCKNMGLPLIEDAACALGHSTGHATQGRMAGSFGDISTLSFSVPKIVTTGQGGALLTSQPELRDKAAAYIDQGDLNWRKTNINHAIGSNLRYNDILSAIGMAQLKNIAARQKRRNAVYAVMKARLKDFLFAPPDDQAPLHHIVFTKEPRKLIAFLQEKAITAVMPYHFYGDHPPFRDLADGAFPAARFWTDHAVYLPCGLALEPADAERMADAVLASGTPLLAWPPA